MIDEKLKRLEKLEAERAQLVELLDKFELSRPALVEDDYCEEFESLVSGDFIDDDWIELLIGRLVRAATERPKEFQHELFEIVHEGSNKYRSRAPWSVAEKVFADQWKEYNKDRNVIQSIVGEDVTQREASMVADAIQWLGTNCGSGFVRECERRIDEIVRQHDVIEYRDMHKDDVDYAARVRAIANGVIQKMAIGRALYAGGKVTYDEAMKKAVEELCELTGRRAFDIEA